MDLEIGKCWGCSKVSTLPMEAQPNKAEEKNLKIFVDIDIEFSFPMFWFLHWLISG